MTLCIVHPTRDQGRKLIKHSTHCTDVFCDQSSIVTNNGAMCKVFASVAILENTSSNMWI